MVYSEAWRTLSNYESQDLIRLRYNQRFQRTLSAGSAKDCRSSITQARAYFESARDADRTVKPLLLYYGSLGLARSLVLFLRGAREATLAASHGLSADGWQHCLSGTSPNIEGIQTSILANGSFNEFVTATQNISLLTHNSSKPNLAYKHGPLTAGTTLTLDDLLSRLPELGEHYTRWKGLPNFCPVTLEAESAVANAYVNKSLFGLTVDRLFVERFFVPPMPVTFQSDEPRIWYKVSNKFPALPQLWDIRDQYFGKIGDLVLLRDFALSKPSAVLALSYILGMLVRYFPSHWMALVRNEASDASLPTILAAMDFIEEQFPKMVLELFERDLITGDRTASRS
jgi:hypothetical protein